MWRVKDRVRWKKREIKGVGEWMREGVRGRENEWVEREGEGDTGKWEKS